MVLYISQAFPGELKTENIQYLAVNLEIFNTILRDCLFTGQHQPPAYPHSWLPDLKGLILVLADAPHGVHMDADVFDYHHNHDAYRFDDGQGLEPEIFIVNCITLDRKGAKTCSMKLSRSTGWYHRTGSGVLPGRSSR